MDKTTSKTKKIVAWCFYDWAVSAYFSIVTTFIFSAYFASQVVTNKVLGVYLWGNAIGMSAFIIALVSPIVGSIADYGGYRKRWLFVMTYLGVISSLGLWFAFPASAHIWFILL